MKKYIIIFMVFWVSINYVQASINQQQADQLALSYAADSMNLPENYLLLSFGFLNANSTIYTISSSHDYTSPDYDSYFYFINNPFSNWLGGHYLFVNKVNGNIETMIKDYQPLGCETANSLTSIDTSNMGSPQYFNFSPSNSFGGCPEHNYAVIISGGYDKYNNHIRYWNDCQAMYEVLRNVYNYKPENIYCLVSDGTDTGEDRHHYDGTYDSSPLDFDGDGNDDIGYSATVSSITEVFDELGASLTQNDFLYIFTTDHGGSEEGLYLWNRENMSTTDFAEQIDKVNAGHIAVTMEQCFSGAFVSPICIDNRTISTAASANESSWAMPPDYTYNEYVYHWIAAMGGTDPLGTPVDADSDSDGLVSFNEAFTYAEANDTRPETPQYCSQGLIHGDHFGLSGFGNTCCGNGDNIDIYDLETYDTDMDVPGNIIINPGAQLTVTAQLKFGDNKRIIVKRGSKLVLDGGHLTICDNATQWEGIIVEGNSILPQPDYWEMPAPDEAGIVVTKNNAKIENAHIGISTNYSGQWTDQKWGGVVHCEDTEFSGCWKGIEFMKYDLENKSYIGNCTFSGWKEGITIWATDGIEIENCSFDDQYLGVGFLDSKVFVQHNNSFTGCTRGILAMESIPGDSRLVVEDDNEFINNDTAIVLSGQNYSDIRNNNYFESNDVGVKISGYTQVDIFNNFFVANNDNITSDVTGNNYNVFSCNVMTGQDKGIWYLNENLKSEFLSNDFIGTYDADVFGLNADINEKVGSKYDPALNLFSDIDHDLYWADYLGNSEFIYYLPHDPMPRTDPKYNGNFIEDNSSGNGNSNRCIDIPPPIITTVILKKVIEDYCYWYHKYKESPHNGYYKKMFRKYEKKLHSYYYYWKYSQDDKKTWKEIEEILKTICGHKWKVTLFGHYLSAGYFSKADSMLNVINSLKDKGSSIPEDMSDEQIEAFIDIQRINIKLHEINGYQINDVEKETLLKYSLKDIPESAYAIGTYYLATGELISRPLPDYEERLEYRAKEYKKQEWLVYPNPASNILNIVCGGKNKYEGTIEMFDILGNKVLKTDYLLKRGRKKQLDVSSLKSGIYLLNILDNNDKSIKTERVVIEFEK